MNASATTGALFAALSAAQGEIEGASKDANNPYFSSKYATLAAVWEACRKALAAQKLGVVQSPGTDEHGLFLETILGHASGEWISSKLYVTPVKDDPQGIGSAITYARRYALAAMVGVAPEDDDGEAAMGRTKGKPADVPKTWREEICHVGSKAKGKPLSKLDNAQIGALHEYMSDPKNQTTKQDKSLLAALSIAIVELGITPKKAPPADDIPIDCKKQLLELIEFNGYTGDDLIKVGKQAKWTTASFYDDITEAEAAEMFKNSDTVLDAIKTMKGAK